MWIAHSLGQGKQKMASRELWRPLLNAAPDRLKIRWRKRKVHFFIFTVSFLVCKFTELHMAKRVGIVGYGKLGRYLAHAVLDRPETLQLAFVWNRSVAGIVKLSCASSVL